LGGELGGRVVTPARSPVTLPDATQGIPQRLRPCGQVGVVLVEHGSTTMPQQFRNLCIGNAIGKGIRSKRMAFTLAHEHCLNGIVPGHDLLNYLTQKFVRKWNAGRFLVMNEFWRASVYDWVRQPGEEGLLFPKCEEE